ncbi:ShlB/FhaC/HecB family hemolysin secretion/activation protein [Sphingomonas sp. GB1N7]|uniref:ShlB/FhaC/HecB family hemolysin secretion/activation protein n=1 Tax=Parasphingomonas caseinilytica TaxID=3096158 RepID=UPI002FCBFC7C
MIALLLAAALPSQSGPSDIVIDRNRIDRARPPATPSNAPPEREKTVIATKGSQTPIAGIAFRGAQAPAPVAEAARAFLGKPASAENLQLLAAALSTAYAKTEVALYTVAIPEQDFSGGTIIVLLTEGKVAAVTVKGDGHALLRRRLARMTEEAPLTRATFERQITLARAIPGLTFDSDFQDPAADGALALTVTPKQKRHKFSLGFSNRGVDLLGDGQFDATAEFYGLATDGDQLSFNASTASDFRRYRYGAIGYTAPLTASGLTIAANAAYLQTRPKGLNITGKAKLAGLSIAYPWLRDFHRSGDISIGVDGLNSDNAAFGNLIATERTRALRIAGSFAMARERRSLSVSGSVSRGLDLLGARVTFPLAEAKFFKGNLAANAAQQIGKRAFVRLSASGQYSADRLPAAERFAIGGEGVGRAFDTGLLTGDRGAGGSAEIALRPIRAAKFAQSELYCFVDGGSVGLADRGFGRQSYSLASTGIGVRARYREKAELGLEAARTIDDPYPGYSEKWRISVAWRLTL